MSSEPPDPAGLTLDPSTARQEPEVPPETAQPFEEAALIGGERLKSSGFFVNVVPGRVAAAPPTGTPLVLVVEDDAGTAGTIEAILRKKGYATRVAGNLQAIIRAVGEKPRPDLVLLDVLLPDANGFALLERLRRHPELSKVPVVMLTSLSEPGDVAKGLALGAAGYLSKPARPRALLDAIREVLALPE